MGTPAYLAPAFVSSFPVSHLAGLAAVERGSAPRAFRGDFLLRVALRVGALAACATLHRHRSPESNKDTSSGQGLAQINGVGAHE